MDNQSPERFEFQAEIKQLLDLVVHSLYTEKDIFVRELISNASDAIERLRHLQLTENDVYDNDLPLEINVTTDPAGKTLTIQDSGVGFTREELVENLGKIAHSGSRAFLKSLGEGAHKSTTLIGRFGVGFYSAFMVAKSVTVLTRSWRPNERGWAWTSDGTGSYEIVEAEGQSRGTKIVLELKEDCGDFASDWKIGEILKRYSAFVSFPINLNGTRTNVVEALWLRSKSQTTDEEYSEFYKFQAHAYDEPRLRLHFSADVPLSISALLFVPHDNSERFGLSTGEPSVALYARRVLIDAHPKGLLPNWLRFLKGVVDSDDVPLNISRQSMQDQSLVAKLRSVITVRFLRFLDEEATLRPDSYDAFYEEFGRFLKEGAAVDASQRELLAKLIRYESSATEPRKKTSLSDYVSRMRPDQTDIYYLIGPHRAAIERGPYLEAFRARGLEVLYCSDPVDEYVMSNIRAFDGKDIVAVDHADAKLPAPELNETPDSDRESLTSADTSTLTDWLRSVLDDRVSEVKMSDRLVDSPVLAVSADKFTSPHMRRMMRAMNREGGDAPVRVRLEINPRHAVITRLFETRLTNPETATLVAQQLLDNALLSAGLLDDPTTMVTRLNQLLQHV